jgi:HAD superfamily hydrolase (TIGR01484 family)
MVFCGVRACRKQEKFTLNLEALGVAGDVRVVAFDLDDTLAVSKSQIDPEMAALLDRLLERFEVCIISGGRFEQFEAQVLARLGAAGDLKLKLHLMPTCGTRYYRWQAGAWVQVYAEDFRAEDKAEIVDALVEGAKQLGLWREQTWGPIIEDRGSQITFSALGQNAPPAEKYAWDPGGGKRAALRELVARRIPQWEIRSGGSTSIDITKKGVDKAYGMRKLMAALDLKMENILFVGDRLDEGGNDYPVREMGIATVSVEGWPETARYVASLLAVTDAAQAGAS